MSTFGSEITLVRRLEERSSSTASEKPVPVTEECPAYTNMKSEDNMHVIHKGH